jgi:hypothetical protein
MGGIKPSYPEVRIWEKGVVVQRSDDRSYIVETAEGTRYRRNRYHLRKTAESAPVPSEVGKLILKQSAKVPRGVIEP